jgi:hypothetical protein
VERELCPTDPPTALALFQAFIDTDASWFERADDSDGVIGDAVRSACRPLAARCRALRDPALRVARSLARALPGRSVRRTQRVPVTRACCSTRRRSASWSPSSMRSCRPPCHYCPNPCATWRREGARFAALQPRSEPGAAPVLRPGPHPSLWSINRGLARKQERYDAMLGVADMPQAVDTRTIPAQAGGRRRHERQQCVGQQTHLLALRDVGPRTTGPHGTGRLESTSCCRSRFRGKRTFADFAERP